VEWTGNQFFTTDSPPYTIITQGISQNPYLLHPIYVDELKYAMRKEIEKAYSTPAATFPN